MIKVKCNDMMISASISGKIHDTEWDGRETKSITMNGDFSTVDALFQDGTAWIIVEETETVVPAADENGNPIYDESGELVVEKKIVRNEYDNSDFCVRGDLTVHVDGSCTVKMGKETDEEKLLVLLYGGEK